jgi:hypothetical protein
MYFRMPCRGKAVVPKTASVVSVDKAMRAIPLFFERDIARIRDVVAPQL